MPVQYDNSQCVVSFGSSKLDLNTFKSKFPENYFHVLKQVHGDRILYVDSSTLQHPVNSLIPADGHWTSLENTSLVIATADCLPIMICSCTDKHWVAALHAGWKGVRAGIVTRFLQTAKLTQRLKHPDHVKVWIGPHILFNSFEIEEAHAKEILQSAKLYIDYSRTDLIRKSENPGKVYLNLQLVVVEQFKAFGISANQIELAKEDTYSSDRYFSYRRDKTNPGRQYSMIYMKSK